MAALFGRLEEFAQDKEDWPSYVECLGYFFVANSIETEGKKKAVLLSAIGAGTYKLLKNLLAPAKLGDKTFAELTQAMEKHFNPLPSETLQRYRCYVIDLSVESTTTPYRGDC